MMTILYIFLLIWLSPLIFGIVGLLCAAPIQVFDELAHPQEFPWPRYTPIRDDDTVIWYLRFRDNCCYCRVDVSDIPMRELKIALAFEEARS